ncbi:unnamed protein product, partial [Mesorhabditis spiculigera]
MLASLKFYPQTLGGRLARAGFSTSQAQHLQYVPGNRRRNPPRGKLTTYDRPTPGKPSRGCFYSSGEGSSSGADVPPPRSLILPRSSGSSSTLQPPQPHYLPYPKEIVEYLDRHVIGQEDAKRVLAVAVYQHYQRLLHNLDVEETRQIREMLLESRASKQRPPSVEARPLKFRKGKAYIEMEPEEVEFRSARERLIDTLTMARYKMSSYEQPRPEELPIEKSNIILGGPSGSGKTYLTQKLADVLHVPIAMCDCTTLTQAGYVGEDVESVIARLLQNADGDVERAETGIVFLDELDKINTSSDPVHSTGNRDVSGRGVQTGLLKLVEGHMVKVKNPLNPMQKVDVNTKNILFIGSGAFNGLERVVARRLEERSLGFGSSTTSRMAGLSEGCEQERAQHRDQLTMLADQGDLIEYGMIPELIGRFPVFVPFHSLNRSLLVRVLNEPANSLLQQERRLLSLDGIDLGFTPCAIEAIADEAVQRKTGARALRSILERTLRNAKYEVPGSSFKKIRIDSGSVRGEKKYHAE